MSSRNFITTAWDIVSGYVINIKICFVYNDLSRQSPYYRGDAAENWI